MTRQLTFLFILGLFFQSQAQVVRRSIIGHISNDSISVENIHILNKNTKKGTISNQYGVFKIPVKENDTLIFDGIQFQKKELRITQNMLKSKRVKVALIQKINELQTVEVKNHNLSGELLSDARKVKKPISMMSKGVLNLGEINFNAVSDIDDIDRSLAPDPFRGTSAQVQGGANLIGLASLILTPAIKGISKIGQRKRRLKRAKREREKIALKVPDKIRDELGDAFFVKDLKIPKDQIDAFIIYCKSKGIVDLFMDGKKIEMIELLVGESDNFKAYIKTQK